MNFWTCLFENDYIERNDMDNLQERSVLQQRNVSRIEKQRTKASSQLQGRLEELEEQVGSLQLLSRVLLKMLRQDNKWNEDKFKMMLHEIDLKNRRKASSK